MVQYKLKFFDYIKYMYGGDFENTIEQELVDILDKDLEGLCEAISKEDDEFSKALYDWVTNHPNYYYEELGVSIMGNVDFDIRDIKLESADIDTGKLDMSIIISINVALLKETFEAFYDDYDK